MCRMGLQHSNKSLRLSTHIQACYYWLSKFVREIFTLCKTKKVLFFTSHKNRFTNEIRHENETTQILKDNKVIFKGISC